jgi:hypothetical protein
MQRTERFTACRTCVGCICQQEALLIIKLCNDCVDPRIPKADLSKMSAHYFASGQLPRAEQEREFAKTQVANHAV